MRLIVGGSLTGASAKYALVGLVLTRRRRFQTRIPTRLFPEPALACREQRRKWRGTARSGIVAGDAARRSDYPRPGPRRRRPRACPCAEALRDAADLRDPADADRARPRNAVFGHAAGLCRRALPFRG